MRQIARLPFLLALCLQACTDQSENNLIGTWGVEQVLYPTVQGQLTIDTRKQPWSASIAGYSASIIKVGDSLSLSINGDTEKFIGFIDQSHNQINGHWIQPARIAPYEQPYASPVVLTEISAGVYSGDVSPLEQSISFYIVIEKNDAGKLTGFIRNYEANYYNRRTYDVTFNKNKVVFQHKEMPEEALYDKEKDQLTCTLLNGYSPLVLTRRTNNVLHFFPRLGNEKYEYKKPIPEADGWETASLDEVNIDQNTIESFIQMIIDAKPSLDNPLNIHSLLIARHGKLVVEEYFYGHYKDKPHDMRSASKTIAPILVGIANEKGYNIDDNTPVYSFFPEYKPFKNWDERKNKITLKDLMSMNSGLAVDDSDPSSPGTEWAALTQKATPDIYKYTLDLPMISEPGGTPVYGGASTNLIGAFLRKSTSQWIPQFFDIYFARPLQIPTYHMNLLPSGEAYLGGGLYMRSRDQLKLGQLYLSKGKWSGQQIIGEEWVNESLVSRGIMKPRIDTDVNHGYGYAWHFRSQKLGNKETSYYWAGGNGGQLIIVVPELDLVVGFTGGDYTEFQKYLLWEIEYLPKYILPSVN